MMIPLSSGVTVFRFERLAVDILGWLITLLTLGVMILIVVSRRRAALGEAVRGRLAPWVARLRRPLRWTVAGVAALAALLLLLKAAGVLSEKARPRSLTHEISDARVHLRLYKGGVKRCTAFHFGRWICGPGRRWVGPVAEEWNLLNRFGLWAHPDETGVLVVTFPERRLGSALAIDYGILKEGGVGVPVTLEVYINGKPVGRTAWPRGKKGPSGWASRPLTIDTKAFKGKRATLRFEISAPHIGGRHFAFDPRIIP